jgi:ABC-type transport system involved in cytochrome c biogenesis ATPase subunit
LLVCVDPFSGLDNDGVDIVSRMFRQHVCGGRAIVILTSNPDGAEVACADHSHSLY